VVPSFSNSRFSLAVVGLVVLGLGLVYPTDQPAVPTTLIMMGSASLAGAALLPRLRQFEIGPGGLKTTFEGSAAASSFDVDAGKLNRFAHKMLGDPRRGREIVETALAKVPQRRHQISASDRSSVTMRLVIDALCSAKERGWLSGKPLVAPTGSHLEEETAMDRVVRALQEIDAPARASYLLRVDEDWSLPFVEIARLLERPVETIEAEVAQARRVLQPYFDSEAV